MRAAVIGGGSWGTAFAQVLCDAGQDVVQWARDPQIVDAINARHENPAYHPGIRLPEQLTATGDVFAALAGAELVVLGMPTQTVRAALEHWGAAIPANAVVLSLAKGIEQDTDLRVSEIVQQVTGIGPERIAVLSGPNLSGEIILREPTATTVACSDEATAIEMQRVCTAPYFRPYYTTDVTGVEIAGATKNVIALATGIAAGMRLGENAQAALVTRGLAEMTRFGAAVGANPLTFLGLSGVGDLVATCASPLSRNRSFGVHLGEGMTVQQVIDTTKQTCEAVKSCQPIVELAESHGVEMPIAQAVVAVVHHGMPAAELVDRFMSRRTKADSGAEHH